MSLSRRKFLAAAVAAALYTPPGSLFAQTTRKLQTDDDVAQASATSLARAIRDKSLSSVEVVEAYLRRIDNTLTTKR